MKVVAIIQARMGSTRLPGKVLRRLCGVTVLEHVISRVRLVGGLSEIVIATTDQEADDGIESAVTQLGISVFRGSNEDVLDRYYRAACRANAKAVVRITSDCPFLDPGIVDAMLDRFHAECANDSSLVYLSNTVTRSFPRGFDAEVFTFAALERAWREAKLSAEREHVTPYLYGHKDIFTVLQHVGLRDLSHYRLTLDTEDDWNMLQALCAGLGCASRLVPATEIVEFLENHPEIVRLNAHVEQKSFAS